MGFNMRVSDNFGADFINGIVKDVQTVEKNTLNKSAKAIKQAAESNLRRLQKPRYNKKGYLLERPRDVHMADDVVIRTGKDKFGNKVVKIGGGKQTGTLWHIVNDGTFTAKPTHFMDNTINQTATDTEMNLDQELGRLFNK